METQRFVMSPTKERDMFIKNVMGKLDRMEERRFANQDAVSPTVKRETELTKVGQSECCFYLAFRTKINGIDSGTTSKM
jgi:hypothetical protein